MMQARSETFSETAVHFDLREELCKHGWKGEMTIQEAEQMLGGKPVFSYLVRLGEEKRKFTLSFVAVDSTVRHVHFVLVDWANGIFQNGGPFKGSLGELICYKMNCAVSQMKSV